MYERTRFGFTVLELNGSWNYTWQELMTANFYNNPVKLALKQTTRRPVDIYISYLNKSVKRLYLIRGED
jgi:hypothetical protein